MLSKLTPTQDMAELALFEKYWSGDALALEQIIMSNMDTATLCATRYRRRCQNVGIEWEEVKAIALSTLVDAAVTWRRKKDYQVFQLFMAMLIKRRVLNEYHQKARPISLGTGWSSTAFKHLPEFLASKGVTDLTNVPRRHIKAASAAFHLGETAIRAILEIRRAPFINSTSFEQRFEEGGNKEDWVSKLIDPNWHDAQIWLLNPEEFLIWKEGDTGIEGYYFSVDHMRALFKQWLYLIPSIERLILHHRYIQPSLMGKEGGPLSFDMVTKAQTLQIFNVTAENAETLERAALVRLKEFALKDFTHAAQPEVKDQLTALRLDTVRSKADEEWELWLKLLLKKERQVIMNRWFYHKIRPVPFQHFCKFSGPTIHGEFGLNMLVEEARQHEDSALNKLENFAAGNFVDADFTVLAEKLPLEFVEDYYHNMPKSSGHYSVKMRLLTFNSPTVKGKEYAVRGSLTSVVRKWLKRMSEQAGRTLSKDEAMAIVQQEYGDICRRMVKSALDDGIRIEMKEEEAPKYLNTASLHGYLTQDELEKILSQAKGKKLTLGKEERKELRAKISFQPDCPLTLDEKNVLRRMLKLYAEGKSTYELALDFKGTFGWHHVRLQQFFMTYTTSALRKQAREHGVVD